MPDFFMGDPKHFRISYELDTNDAMDVSRQPGFPLAHREWEYLRSTFMSRGVSVTTLPAAPDLPDFTFVANAGLALPWENAFILSNFHHSERNRELSHLRRQLQQRFEIFELLPWETFEGEGDAFFWSDSVLFIGYGIRTNFKGALAVERIVRRFRPKIQIEFLEMRLVRGVGPNGKMSFYHRDMCLAPMPLRSAFLYYPPSFIRTVPAILQKYGLVRSVTEEQLHRFVANAVEISTDAVVLPWKDEKTDKLFREDLGYRDVVVCPTTQFHLSGGGPACLRFSVPKF